MNVSQEPGVARDPSPSAFVLQTGKLRPWAGRCLPKVTESWAWNRHDHSQPRLLLQHGVLGMNEEDRQGCGQGLKCLVRNLRVPGRKERVLNSLDLGCSEQIWGVRPGALDQGSSRDSREFAQQSWLQPPNTPAWPGSGCQPGRFRLHSASFESGVLVSPSLKEVSDLREGIKFCVLFHPKEKLICSRMN